MRKILFGLAGLVLALLVIALALPMFIPASAYKEKIEQAASDSLGRTVTLEEVTSVTILPQPAFEVTGLSVANVPGMKAAEFARVEKAELGVKLFPLLGRKVDITRFVLTQPRVNLEKAANGAVNWDFAQADETGAVDAAGGDNNGLRDLSFGDVRLVGGSLSLDDRAAGQKFAATDADISLTLASLDKPMTADGTMVFQGSTAKFTLKIDTLRALMEKRETGFRLDATVGDNRVDTDMTLGAGELNYNGRLEIDAPSLRALLATLGMQIEATNGFENLFIKGDVAGTASTMTLSNGTVRLDDLSSAEGKLIALGFDWGGARPKVSGDLALADLDLRRYLPPPSPEQEKARNNKDAAFPPWPGDRIDFSMLKAIDADITASTTGVLLHNLTFGESRLDLDLNNGLMTAALAETALYSGNGKVDVTVNARKATPQLEAALDLSGLNARNFASEVLGLDRLEGIGGLSTSLSARGDNVAAFMRTLDGSGEISVEKGALDGVDIGKIVKTANTLLQGFEGGKFDVSAFGAAIAEARGPQSETRFSELATRYTITNGVLSTDDALLQGPFFAINGAGTVDLSSQSVNLNFVPTVFETAENINGRRLALPLRVTGTFNQPKIGFDTEGLLRGTLEDKAKDLLKSKGVDLPDGESLEDTLKSKAKDELGKALGLGQPKDDETAPAEDGSSDEAASTGGEDEEEKSVEDQAKEAILDSIFGGGKKED